MVLAISSNGNTDDDLTTHVSWILAAKPLSGFPVPGAHQARTMAPLCTAALAKEAGQTRRWCWCCRTLAETTVEAAVATAAVALGPRVDYLVCYPNGGRVTRCYGSACDHLSDPTSSS